MAQSGLTDVMSVPTGFFESIHEDAAYKSSAASATEPCSRFRWHASARDCRPIREVIQGIGWGARMRSHIACIPWGNCRKVRRPARCLPTSHQRSSTFS